MTYWDAYCDPGVRAGYKRLLCSTGYSVLEAEDIIHKFQVYVSRIKGTALAAELVSITDRSAFSAKLDDIFLVKWKNNIIDSYKILYHHFKAFLSYLQIAQAIRGEYINDEEKKEIECCQIDFPAEELTNLETSVVKDGKLLALVNPTLIYRIRLQLNEPGRQMKLAGQMCSMYYGDLLPQMTITDYYALIRGCWETKGKVVHRGHDRLFQITYPDGVTKLFQQTDGLKEIVLFYGPEIVCSKKVMIRGNYLIVNIMPYIGKQKYIELDNGYFLLTTGNFQDKLKAANAINIMCGKKLKIELYS